MQDFDFELIERVLVPMLSNNSVNNNGIIKSINEYKPTVKDCLFARRDTYGMLTTRVSLVTPQQQQNKSQNRHGRKFTLVYNQSQNASTLELFSVPVLSITDIGGIRSQRKKLTNYYHFVTELQVEEYDKAKKQKKNSKLMMPVQYAQQQFNVSTVFVVNLLCYTETCYEDDITNKMNETLMVFEDLVEYAIVTRRLKHRCLVVLLFAKKCLPKQNMMFQKHQ